MDNASKGSLWGRWDLHVHTPSSIIQNYGSQSDETWEAFIKDLENLPVDFTVIGINDYWFLDGYAKVLNFKINGRLKNIKTIFPVCEFRIKKFAGVDFQKLKRINLHVIFSPNLKPDLIQSQFLNSLDEAYSLDPDCKGCSWAGVITKDSLLELGKQIRARIPTDKPNNFTDLELGFNNLNIDEEKLLTKLNGNTFLKGQWFTAVGKTEWADLKWTEATIAEKTDIINKVNFIFTCANSSEEYKKAKESLHKQNVKDLLLDCSDAHNFSDKKNSDESLIRERIGNSFTWIKAETTFEGLKQVLHEPNYRLQISENRPREPHRKIESIKFNFPETTRIKRHESNTYQSLCLNKITEEIYFSPYFTCLIGGRGTGKSTIINLLAERLGNESDFFRQNDLFLQENGLKYNLKNDPSNLVIVQGTNEIEFVSQGRIEKLTEGNELNKMIFEERILDSNAELKGNQESLKETIKLINEQIAYHFEFSEITKEVADYQKELDKYQDVIDSINDQIYINGSEEIQKLSKRKSEIEKSKTKYNNIILALKQLLQETFLEPTLNNQYETRLEEITGHLYLLSELENDIAGPKINLITYKEAETEIEAIDTAIGVQKEILLNFFTERGTSEESIKDAQSANENVARIQNLIQIQNQKLITIQSRIGDNKAKIDLLKDLRDEINGRISESLNTINGKLKHQNENVAPISYVFEFDEENFKNELFNEFYETFRARYHKPNMTIGSVKEVLFLLEPTEELLTKSHETFLTELLIQIQSRGYNRNTLYVSVILNIFEKENNFTVYKELIKKHRFNVIEYLYIKGFYGPRPLPECSFGQKCTAVIVTLLMSGIKPLIIDEPEAHLDNRLIADYLIDLIKDKKSDRQIIFATHNANFVINGDAELIHILDIPDNDCYTKVISTTIENTNNRESLLKLEGGRLAFEKREKKLLSIS